MNVNYFGDENKYFNFGTKYNGCYNWIGDNTCRYGIITSIIFILTILYQNIINKIMISKYINIYGSLASIVTSLIWLYLNCYIFLVGIAILLFKDEYKENQKSI